MLKEYGIETAGKHCVVVGRSNIVGSPMSILMARNTSTGQLYGNYLPQPHP
jgi:methylenetetrahydrofolate dehydrogenase (NADP+)/methenyltetrahydrofolate cyclohydrolase